MACTNSAKITLFAVYVVSIVSALANPANLHYEDAYTLTQAANITTLLLLSYCKRSWSDAFIGSGLGVAFALRTTGFWRGGTRWDSLLVTLGMLVILQHAFYQVVPKALPYKFIVYLGFSCIIMPVLSALPHLVRAPQIDHGVLQQAANFSTQAYKLGKTSDELSGPLWKLYDAGTDTLAGVSRVVGQRGSELYVYFAGTDSWLDVKTDINLLGDSVPPDWGCSSGTVMRTHRGFTRSFNAIAPKLLGALETELALHPVNKLVFCGHSLGGSLAIMAALYTACKLPQYRQHIVVVSIGSPQVGDGNFVKYFDQVVPTSVRIVNPIDPVPRLLSAQYVHVKGYYPVGTLSLDTVLKSHPLETYIDALSKSRHVAIVGAFMPAVIVASIIGIYIAWQLKRV